jgi:Cu/Ag efflux protein CusF
VKRALALIVSLMFVLSFAGFAAAEKAMEKTPAAPAGDRTAPAVKKAPAKVKQVTGEVTAVDMKDSMVTVKGKKGDVVVMVNEKTKIMMEKEKKTLSDMKAGDKVTVKYSEMDGRNIAKSIAMKGAAKSDAAKPAEKK